MTAADIAAAAIVRAQRYVTMRDGQAALIALRAARAALRGVQPRDPNKHFLVGDYYVLAFEVERLIGPTDLAGARLARTRPRKLSTVGVTLLRLPGNMEEYPATALRALHDRGFIISPLKGYVDLTAKGMKAKMAVLKILGLMRTTKRRRRR